MRRFIPALPPQPNPGSFVEGDWIKLDRVFLSRESELASSPVIKFPNTAANKADPQKTIHSIPQSRDK